MPPPMPPMMPPPYFMYPPPPPPAPQKSFGRAILTTLATTIFSLSLLLNIYLLLATGLMSQRDSGRSKTIVQGDADQVVAVVPLSGLIDDKSYEKFNKLLKRVEEDSNVKAMVIQIDSPGGSVTASDEIYHAIMDYKLRHQNVPVVISMAGLAASGGYYSACAGDYIFAQPTTITGSIGVLLPKYNLSKLADKWGIEDTSQHSTGADFKTAGSPLRPEKPEETAYLQGVIDNAFVRFKKIVKDSRPLTASIDTIANGKIYTADEALGFKLIDQIGYLMDACNYAAAQAKLSKKTVIRFEDTPSLMELFGSESAQGGASRMSAQGLNVQIDMNKLIEALSPRPMYLWQGQ